MQWKRSRNTIQHGKELMDEYSLNKEGVDLDDTIPYTKQYEHMFSKTYSENLTGNALQTASRKSQDLLSSMLGLINDEQFQIESLRNSPFPSLGEDQNKISSAYANDLKTVGYGRADRGSPRKTTYNNSFDPRLSFRGLGEEVFTPRTEDDDDKSKAQMTENVFLALDNPSALVNDYLYGYREYLRGLTSLPTIHIGSGDEPISDDGSDECKRLFQRIRSESVKSMFLPETEIPQHTESGILSESPDNCKSSPTAYTHQNHNQSNQLDLNEPSLSTATVLKHSQERVESKLPKNVSKSMCEETFDESMSNNISPNISRDQAPLPNIKSPPGFPQVHGNKETDKIMKTDKPAEDSKHIDHESSTQTKDVTTSGNTQHPPAKQETTGQQVPLSSESKKQEIGTKQKSVDVTKKTYSGNRPQTHKSVPPLSKQREPLKEKRLKDLSELRQQARASGEGATVTKDQSVPCNASWAEKLFHKEAEGKDKDSKEKRNSHEIKPWMEKSSKSVTSNLRASSEPFIPPSHVSKSNNAFQVQATTLVPVEEFKPRPYSLTTHAQTINFPSNLQHTPHPQPPNMYVPTNIPPPPVHNWAQFNSQQNFPRLQDTFQPGNWFNDNSMAQPVKYDGYQYQQQFPDPATVTPVDQFVPTVMQNSPSYGQSYQYNQVGGNYSFGNVLQSNNATTNVPPQYTFSQHRFLPTVNCQQNIQQQPFYSHREFRNGVPFNYNNNSSSSSNNNNNYNNNNNNNNSNNNNVPEVDGNCCGEVGEGIPCVQFRRSRSCEDLCIDGSKGKPKPRAIRSNLVRIYPTES